MTSVINDLLGQTHSHVSSVAGHVRKQLSLPALIVGWPSGSIEKNMPNVGRLKFCILFIIIHDFAFSVVRLSSGLKWKTRFFYETFWET